MTNPNTKNNSEVLKVLSDELLKLLLDELPDTKYIDFQKKHPELVKDPDSGKLYLDDIQLLSSKSIDIGYRFPDIQIGDLGIIEKYISIGDAVGNIDNDISRNLYSSRFHLPKEKHKDNTPPDLTEKCKCDKPEKSITFITDTYNIVEKIVAGLLDWEYDDFDVNMGVIKIKLYVLDFLEEHKNTIRIINSRQFDDIYDSIEYNRSLSDIEKERLQETFLENYEKKTPFVITSENFSKNEKSYYDLRVEFI